MSNVNKPEFWSGWPLTRITVKNTYGDQGRARNQQVRALREEKKLLNLLDALVPGASTGQPNLEIFDSQIEPLNAHIQQHAEAGRGAMRLRRFLREGLVAGSSELNWSVTIPPGETRLTNPTNPHEPASFELIQALRLQAIEFEKILTADFLASQSSELRWGQFIFSAVVLGGLSDKKALAQLPPKHLELQYHQDYLWLDLFDVITQENLKARRGLRRWFIDPISAILYTQLPALPKAASNKDYWPELERLLHAFLNYLAKQAGQPGHFSCSKTIKTFFSAVRTHQHLLLPPYLAQYCSGEVNSSAWPVEAWQRILFSQRPALNPDLQIELPVLETAPAIRRVEQSASGQQIKAMHRKISEALHRKKGLPEPTFKSVQDKLLMLQSEVEQVSTLSACMLAWFKERHLKKEIKRSSAYQQFTSLSSDLITVIDDRTFVGFDSEEFLGAYEDILERTVASATRANKADLLRRFHAYAVHAVGIAPLNANLTQEDIFALPDAELLTETEYQKIYRVFHTHKNTRDGRVLLLMLILGFRCGLRISEAQNIRLEDLQYRWMMSARPQETGDDKASNNEAVRYKDLTSVAITLLIRPNKYNTGKTINSQRQLPLNLLLNDDERYELLSYHQLQRQMVGDGRENAFLFSQSTNNAEPLDFTHPQQILHDALREMTGNPSLRYHHLRHSFASHLAQCLQGDDAPLEINEHWRNHLKPKTQTRKNLFQMADFIGHSSPQVTLNHYVHNLDVLLRNQLWNYSFAHTRTGIGEIVSYRLVSDISAAVTTLLGISDDNMRYRNKQYKNIMHWLPRQLKAKEAYSSDAWIDYPHLDLSKIAIENSLASFTFDEWCSFLEYWRREKSREKLSEFFRLNEQEAVHHVGILSRIFKSKTRFKASRTVRSDKKGHDGREYIIRPPVGTERIIAQHVFERCMRLLNSDSSKDMAGEGLEYFLTNFRRDQSYIISRHTPEIQEQLQCFEELLSKVLPDDLTYVTNERNPTGHRHKNQGRIKVYSSKTNRASDGVAFALLIAGAVGRMC